MARNLARDAEGNTKQGLALEPDAMTQSIRLDETTAAAVVVAPQTGISATSSGTEQRSPAWAGPTDPATGESANTHPDDLLLLDAASEKSPSSSCPHQALDGTLVPPTPVPTKQKKKVRFDAQPITAIWPAVSEYDRRSIVVDLSKTPFALFRKDAVMMKTGTTGDPSAPLPPPAPPAHPAGAVSNSAPRTVIVPAVVPEAETITTTTTTSTPACGDSSTGDVIDASSLPEAPPSPRRRSEQTGSWDSDSSDSSCGHTDTETDFEQSDHDTDSNHPPSCCLVEQQQLERRGSSTDGPAFYGVWKRTSSEGYEELLLSSGVPKRAVAMAALKRPVHIIDHDGTYFRLIVRNGLSKVDNTLFIGDEPRLDVIGKQSYEVSLNWAHLTGHGTKDELSLSSICREKGEEVIAIRSLENGGDRMVLTQIVRRPAEGYEVRAKHFFKRVTDKSELRSNGREPPSSVVTVRRKKKC